MLTDIQERVLALLASRWRIPNPRISEFLQTYPTRFVLVVVRGKDTLAVKVDLQASSAVTPGKVLCYLQSKKFIHCPRIHLTSDVAFTATESDIQITVLEYIPNEFPGDTSWSALGKAASQLNQLNDYSDDYIVDPKGVLIELRTWCSGRPLEDQMLSILEEIGEGLRETSYRGLIHGEINQSNARTRGNGEVVLLDWDEAGIGPVEFELGYPLLTTFFNPTTLHFDRVSARNFYKAYFSESNYTSLSTESIWSFAMLHAVRSMTFFDTEVRWLRVLQSRERKQEILKSLGI